MSLGKSVLALAFMMIGGAANAETLTQGDLDALAQVNVQLGACTAAYMNANPQRAAGVERFAKAGLGPELKAQVLAVLPKDSPRLEFANQQAADTAEGVEYLFSILAEQIRRSTIRTDERELTLEVAVATYQTARMAGPTCKIPAGMNALVARARNADLPAKLLKSAWTTDAADSEFAEVLTCFLGLPAVKGMDGLAANRYAAGRGGAAQIWADAEAVASDPTVPATYRLYLDTLRKTKEPERSGFALGLFTNLSNERMLATGLRFRAKFLLAYHLSKASEGKCQLSSEALDFLAKAKSP